MAASQYPEDSAECCEFLRHKRYLFSPGVLEKGGISYDTVLPCVISVFVCVYVVCVCVVTMCLYDDEVAELCV
jgi:hypothetical protein